MRNQRNLKTLADIKDAVRAGSEVRWSNDNYKVVANKRGDDFYIVSQFNGYTIGLTHTDGVTMNGKIEDFYTKEDAA
jgi:hypothetical protein